MLTNATVADIWRPGEKVRAGLYDLVLIVAGSFLIALSAQLAIGFPVPISGQTFAVVMIGALYGARRGSLCVLLYILEGAAGLPVFANAGFGIAVLSGPRGGYLMGFIAAAFVVGALSQAGWDRRVWTTVLAMLIGNLIIYSFGLSWLFCLMGFSSKVLTVGLYPFIAGDILKTALAAVLLPSGWKLLEHFNFTVNR